jgi:hypothetical protein
LDRLSGIPTCTNASHLVFHADAKWPLKARAEFGVFQVRRKVEYMVFSNLKSFRQIKIYPGTKHGPHLRRSILMERNLLLVNREMRTEVMKLVFEGHEVKLFGLPNKVRGLYNMERFSIFSFALPHITSVTTMCFESEEGLEHGYDCLQFVTINFANLRRLTCDTRLDLLSRVSSEGIMVLVQTIRAATVTMKQLETLRFVWVEDDLTIGPGWNRRKGEMILDKSRWSEVVPEVWRLLYILKKKGEAESERYEAERLARIFGDS